MVTERNILQYYGHSVRAGEQFLLDICAQAIRKDPFVRYYYLVPSRRKARHIERTLAAASGHGIMGRSVFSLNDFIGDVFGILFPNLTVISESTRVSILGYILAMAAREDSGYTFSYFREPQRFSGLPRVLSRFIATVKQDNVWTLDELRDRIHNYNGTDQLTPKDRDILEIFDRYQNHWLKKYPMVDTEDMMKMLLDHESLFKELLRPVDFFIIEGFYDLTAAQQRIIDHIFRHVKQVYIYIDFAGEFPHELTKLPVYNIAVSTYAFFQNAANRIEKISPPEDAARDERITLFSQFFRSPYRFTPDDRIRVNPERFRMISCYDRQSETVFIAREIRHLLDNDSSLTPGELCVTFPRVSRYRYLVEEIFPRYGIPYILSQGIPLSSSPWVCALFNLFQVVETLFARKSVFQFFNSPYVSFSREIAGEPVTLDITAIDTWARSATVSGGNDDLQESWFNPLKRLKRSWEKKRDKAKNDDDEETYYNAERLSNRIRNIERQTGVLMQAFQVIHDRIRPEMTPVEFSGFINELVDIFSIRANILHTLRPENSADILEDEIRASNKFFRVMEQLVGTLEMLDNRAYMFTELVNILRAAVHEESVYRRQDNMNRVQVSGLLDIRAVEFSYVFFAGLTETDFPLRDPPEILYPPGNDQPRVLANQIDRMQESQLLFQQTCVKGSRRVYLSHPGNDGGEELSPCIQWKELERIGIFDDSKTPTVPDVSHGPPDKVYSWKELFRWITGKLDERPDTPVENVVAEIQSLMSDEELEARIIQTLQHLYVAEQRNCPNILSAYECILQDTENISELEKIFHPDKYVYSISQLELFAKCPLEFWFRRVLGLEPLEEIEEEVTPLDRGSLVHRILYEFYMYYLKNQSQPGSGVDITGIPIHELARSIKEITADILGGYHYTGTYWERFRERLTAGLDDPDNAREQGVLLQFLNNERKESKQNFPAYFEASFGMKKHVQDVSQVLLKDPLKIKSTKDNFHIRIQGKIDRVDLGNVPENPDKKQFYVVDYKTGSSYPFRKRIEEGVSFQLPIYIHAVREYGKTKMIEPYGGGYCMVPLEGEVISKDIFMNKEIKGKKSWTQEDFMRILDIDIPEWISQIVYAIHSGYYPASYRDDDRSCARCDYRNICRRDPGKIQNIFKQIKDGTSKYTGFYCPDI